MLTRKDNDHNDEHEIKSVIMITKQIMIIIISMR